LLINSNCASKLLVRRSFSVGGKTKKQLKKRDVDSIFQFYAHCPLSLAPSGAFCFVSQNQAFQEDYADV